MERRRAPRVPMEPPTNPVSVVGARIIDVSPFGMRIESPVAISPDSMLRFRIAVGPHTTDVGCRVAVCQPSPAADAKYGVGLEFLDLDDTFRQHLVVALQRFAADTH